MYCYSDGIKITIFKTDKKIWEPGFYCIIKKLDSKVQEAMSLKTSKSNGQVLFNSELDSLDVQNLSPTYDQPHLKLNM